MARYDFGGTLADFVVTSHRLGTLDTLALSAATLTMWSAQSGGTRYTDLVLNGSAVSSIVVGTDGQVPKFQGPDGVTEMWVDGGSTRIRIVTLQGAPGPAGRDGLPGPTSVPADNAVAGFVGGPSLTDLALRAAFAPGVQVRSKGAKGDGTTDDSAAINAAVTAARAFGAEVHFGKGNYLINSPISAYSNMTYRGAGKGTTTITAVSTGNLRAWVDGEGTTVANPMTNVAWYDMTIDGAGIQGSGSKGFYISYMRRALWSNVEVNNFPATGFGCDFMQDTTFAYCTAKGNGRLLAVNDPGASGFGIGTGAYSVEDVTLIGCHAEGNKNFGIFFEQQPEQNNNQPFFSKGARVIGCYLTGNSYGLGDCGVLGLVATGNQLIGNSLDGFLVNQGTSGLGIPGQAGRFFGNVVTDSGRNGVFIDYTTKDSDADQCRYYIEGNRIASNTSYGIACSGKTVAVKNLTIKNNDVTGSGKDGIRVASSLTAVFEDLTIEDNRVRSNGITTAGSSGIRIQSTVTRGSIARNRCWDTATTKTQTYGIDIAAVTLTDVVLGPNALTGNLTGEHNNLSTRAGAVGTDLQFRNSRAVGIPGLSLTAFQNNDPAAPDNGSRFYFLPRPNQSVTSGVGGVVKLLADDYASNQTDYRDQGWYFHANQVGPAFAGGDTGTRGGGVFWNNSKVNGTFAGKNPDIGWSFQDGQYVAGRVALATVGGVTPNPQFVFGIRPPLVGTKVSVVAEFQGDIGGNMNADTSIRWARTDATTVDNAFTFQRHASGGQLKATLGSTQRLLLTNSGSLVLGNGSSALAATATDGFLYVNSVAGTPTGTPTAQGVAVPMLIDTTASKLWAYIGGAWKSTTLA